MDMHWLALAFGVAGFVCGMASWIGFTSKGQTQMRWINAAPIAMSLIVIWFNAMALLD